jgi:hypothetical protein
MAIKRFFVFKGKLSGINEKYESGRWDNPVLPG